MGEPRSVRVAVSLTEREHDALRESANRQRVPVAKAAARMIRGHLATGGEDSPPPPGGAPPTAGATKDLKTKPVVAPTKTPPPEAVQYADIVEGDGAEAVTGSQVEVKYVGAFYDTGKEFDSSWSRGPDETLPFGICQQGVIPGFAVGPTGMKVGGRRQIIIPSELGYGAQGSPPTIPGGAALVFVVDLVTVS